MKTKLAQYQRKLTHYPIVALPSFGAIRGVADRLADQAGAIRAAEAQVGQQLGLSVTLLLSVFDRSR